MKNGTSVTAEKVNLDIKKLREDFPILSEKVYGKPLVYFDNAATTQKPNQVINSISDYYKHYNSNVHRGVHLLSVKATEAYENARESARAFLNASKKEEIIFTRGVTEGINLAAFSYGSKYVRKGDNIIITAMEHHSNIVPWQMLCERKDAELRVIPVQANGALSLEILDDLINEKTKIVSAGHISNSLGTINDVKLIIEKAHNAGAVVLIDGAQAAPHLSIDVQELNADFYAISGHKVYGPTGIGVLYGKERLLEEMPPYQGGGEMIKNVTLEKTDYNDLPYKFEAGTPDIAGAIGLHSAFDFVNAVGKDNIISYESTLTKYGLSKLLEIDGIRMLGDINHRSSLFSFIIEGVHHYDIGSLLDKMGIAVRTGFHCAQPVMECYKLSGTVRASLAMYNTNEEIDIFYDALVKSLKMLR